MVSLLEHSVATHTRDEAVRLLKEGHIIRHKRFVPGANLYLDAKGKIMCPLWSRPSKMGIEAFVSMFADSEDGWIDLGFRYGNAQKSLQWMRDGGIVRRAQRNPSEYDYCFISEEPGRIMVMVRSRDGHEHYWGPMAEWSEAWADEDFALLPPTCKKVTYEELERHLAKGGRFTDSPNARDWWYRRDGKPMYHAPGGEERLSAYGSYGEDIPVSTLNRLVLLPPLEEEKSEPILAPKTNATSDEARKWLDAGGEVVADRCRCRFRKDGDSIINLTYPGAYSFWWHNDGPGQTYVLLPMDEEEKPKLEPKDGATFEEAQRWLDMGGRVRRYPGDKICWYYKRNGEILFDSGIEGDPYNGTSHDGTFCDEGVYRSLWTLIPMDEPANKKPREAYGGARKEGKTLAEAETIIQHLKDGGIVRLSCRGLGGSMDYSQVDSRLVYRLTDAPETATGDSDYGTHIARFAKDCVDHLRYTLVPAPTKKGPTAEDIIKHLKDGGIVRRAALESCLRDGEIWARWFHKVDRFDEVGMSLETFVSNASCNRGSVLLPKPPTRLEVTEHLRQGGKVQWRDGKPGVWTAFAGVLLWTPKGSTKTLLSHHNCNGHWFGDFTDDEISYLELVAMEKPQNPTPDEIFEHLLKGGKVRETTQSGVVLVIHKDGNKIHWHCVQGPSYYPWTPQPWTPALKMVLANVQEQGTRHELL